MITDVNKLDFKRMVKAKPSVEAQPVDVHLENENNKENMDLLEQARMYWDGMSDFRNRRRRNRRYHRGDQWGDYVKDPLTGETVTEEEYIMRQGKMPLKQNMIRQIMKNLLGQYRRNENKTVVLSRSKGGDKAAEMLTNAIQHVAQLNDKKELDARAVEEFALSGGVISKINYRYFKERNQEDVRVSNVNPSRFFLNTDVQDFRLTDLRMVGEIIDTTVDDIVSNFAKNREEEERIRNIYAQRGRVNYTDYYGFNAKQNDYVDFYIPNDVNKARMFEIWELKSAWRVYAHDYVDGSYEITDLTMDEIKAINNQRIEYGTQQGLREDEIPLIDANEIKEQYWHVKFLSHMGHVLWEGESPYEHEEHPYGIVLHPLIDGEIWGFVEDVIDQQRYVNRMIILMDFMLSSSAKGVLMVPEDAIPTGMTPEQFADDWRSFNGVIVYKPSTKHNKVPEQVTSNSSAVGINDMLKLQMQLLQDISGVHGAIQGQSAGSGKPSSLYAQEAENSTLNTLDFFSTFSYYQKKCDEKILKLIIQYYKEERYFAIAGEDTSTSTVQFDPTAINGKLFDLVVTQGVNTPVYKQMLDETLMKLLEGQLIDLEIFLENSSLPYSSSILESIKNKKNELQQGQIPNFTDIEQPTNPNEKNNQMINQMIGKNIA